MIGAALTPEPATSKGFTIERTYYTLDGKKIDLASATGGTSQLKQNERMVVVLKVEAPETGGRILLVDRLPAGLEIENPRLVDAGDVKTLDWLKTTVKPQHTEFRDDRFVAAFDFFGSSDRRRGRRFADSDEESREPARAATVAYIVRAVTPGSFVHPAATVEDMYRPDRFARTASGRLEVTGRSDGRQRPCAPTGPLPLRGGVGGGGPQPARRRAHPTPIPSPSRGGKRCAALRVASWRAACCVAAAWPPAAVLAVIWQRMEPLPLGRAEALSVTVLDRNDRLLRAYTTADGRWRLPIEPKEVDARYLAMLLAFEDRRFRSHRGVDPSPSAAPAGSSCATAASSPAARR